MVWNRERGFHAFSYVYVVVRGIFQHHQVWNALVELCQFESPEFSPRKNNQLLLLSNSKLDPYLTQHFSRATGYATDAAAFKPSQLASGGLAPFPASRLFEALFRAFHQIKVCFARCWDGEDSSSFSFGIFRSKWVARLMTSTYVSLHPSLCNRVAVSLPRSLHMTSPRLAWWAWLLQIRRMCYLGEWPLHLYLVLRTIYLRLLAPGARGASSRSHFNFRGVIKYEFVVHQARHRSGAGLLSWILSHEQRDDPFVLLRDPSGDYMQGRELERECSNARLTVCYDTAVLPQSKSRNKCAPSNITTTTIIWLSFSFQ
jgi:hypothetical protein